MTELPPLGVEVGGGGMTPVYLYIDEAGNFDFSPKGSKYFILTGVVLRRPFAHIRDLSTIKYDCLEEGIDAKKSPTFHEFHASEDKQAVRDRVFGVIERELGTMRIYSVIIRKNKTNPSIRPMETIYARTFGWLTDYIARKEPIGTGNRVIVITDRVNFKGKNDALKSSLKKFMKERFANRGISYRLYQHSSESDLNLQVVDYCCWAVQRKWERDDDRSYSIIKDMIAGEGDLFKDGDMEYYKFEK